MVNFWYMNKRKKVKVLLNTDEALKRAFFCIDNNIPWGVYL
jgi:hypothetical protein